MPLERLHRLPTALPLGHERSFLFDAAVHVAPRAAVLTHADDVALRRLSDQVGQAGDLLRFVVGFHQERVAELEFQLDQLRSKKMALQAGAIALRQALADAKIETELEISQRIRHAAERQQAIALQLLEARNRSEAARVSGVDKLRSDARQRSSELATVDEMIADLETITGNDRRHLNELLSLATKLRRMTSARAVLNGVEFVCCPRCTQRLPERPTSNCRVCDQPDSFTDLSEDAAEITNRDLDARKLELQELISQREAKLRSLRNSKDELGPRKAAAEMELARASEQYDSMYLSLALTLERERARLTAETEQLERLMLFPRKVDEQLRAVEATTAQETRLRAELRDARASAEQDTANLKLLRKIFLDCLVRAQLPGFSAGDDIEMTPPSFLPEVSNPAETGLITTSFANLGSGGKKTLFKCCFGLAIHRLAVRVGALLPTLLIIDSPMRNISERENATQFEGFHRLIYELAAGELRDTQFIMIDKEVFPPPADSPIRARIRHMTLTDPEHPPLLRGYKE